MGYKVHVTETCNAKAVHVITHVATRTAMEFDISALQSIHKHLAARDMLPKEHFVDSAYVSAGLQVSSQREHGVCLHGPVRELARAGQDYDLPDFKIDWARQQVTCPESKVSVGWTPGLDDAGRPRIHARFGRGDCGNCQAQSLCSQSREKRQSLYCHPRPEYEALNQACQRMHELAWKVFCPKTCVPFVWGEAVMFALQRQRCSKCW